VEDQLGSEVRQALSQRAPQLEEHLRHTFLSLPQNSRGAVGPGGARYALHRLFVQLHGWQMKGLRMEDGDWYRSSPLPAFGNHLPQHLHTFLETRVSHGLDLHELAIVAGLLEHKVHDQAEKRLSLAYKALKQERAAVSRNDAFDIMHTYLATYILGKEDEGESESVAIEKMLTNRQHLDGGYYPRWTEAADLLQQAADAVAPGASSFEFPQILASLERVADQIFHLENRECGAIRQQLTQLEDHDASGRVTLADFYNTTLHNFFSSAFTESEHYLRDAGALDESVPGMPRVIIPNYLMLDSNCLGSSEYYAVCCIDECEVLLDTIESKIHAPTASPKQLTQLVSSLGAEYALDERLHHAFPRVCPFPHEAGSFLASTAAPLEASAEAMRSRIDEAPDKSTTSLEQFKYAMWTDTEQLVDANKHQVRSWGRSYVSILMFAGVVIGTVSSLAKLAPPVARKVD
ncbi:unnamed protein product, partial [Symbiodinium microadriaticum]